MSRRMAFRHVVVGAFKKGQNVVPKVKTRVEISTSNKSKTCSHKPCKPMREEMRPCTYSHHWSNTSVRTLSPINFDDEQKRGKVNTCVSTASNFSSASHLKLFQFKPSNAFKSIKDFKGLKFSAGSKRLANDILSLELWNKIREVRQNPMSKKELGNKIRQLVENPMFKKGLGIRIRELTEDLLFKKTANKIGELMENPMFKKELGIKIGELIEDPMFKKMANKIGELMKDPMFKKALEIFVVFVISNALSPVVATGINVLIYRDGNINAISDSAEVVFIKFCICIALQQVFKDNPDLKKDQAAFLKRVAKKVSGKMTIDAFGDLFEAMKNSEQSKIDNAADGKEVFNMLESSQRETTTHADLIMRENSQRETVMLTEKTDFNMREKQSKEDHATDEKEVLYTREQQSNGDYTIDEKEDLNMGENSQMETTQLTKNEDLPMRENNENIIEELFHFYDISISLHEM